MSRAGIPIYLHKPLKSLAINSVADLLKCGYLQVFAWLRDKYPSTSYKTLYDLYCIAAGLPINSLESVMEQELRNSYKQLLPCYTPLSHTTIIKYLDTAFLQAENAYGHNEIPIGAVVVMDDKIIGSGYNQNKSANLVLRHAEMIAIEKASQYLGTSYLSKCDLYVTVEPCLMCSGAIMAGRLKRVIFGATESKTGAVVSQYQVFNNKALNHHTEAIGPINTAKYSQHLRQFLKAKR